MLFDRFESIFRTGGEKSATLSQKGADCHLVDAEDA